MNKAREEKERIKLFMEKGIINKDKKNGKVSPDMSVLSPSKSSQKEEKKDETGPLLFVDINLGENQQERIVVYEGDTAEGLADKFCELHGLDEETRGKLCELLESQISQVLSRIEEEEG